MFKSDSVFGYNIFAGVAQNGPEMKRPQRERMRKATSSRGFLDSLNSSAADNGWKMSSLVKSPQLMNIADNAIYSIRTDSQ